MRDDGLAHADRHADRRAAKKATACAASSVGADDYVSKPFSLPELFARIRGILRHRRAWLTETSELRRDLRSAVGRAARACFLTSGRRLRGWISPAPASRADRRRRLLRLLRQRAAPGSALLVADVAGKGASAALLMATLQGCVALDRAGARRSMRLPWRAS